MPIKEGLAVVDAPDGDVFYNPTQVFNRDFSLLATATFLNMLKDEDADKCVKRATKMKELEKDCDEKMAPRTFRILEALSASGLRSIRLMKELPPSIPVHLVINDISETAVQAIQRNIESNKTENTVLHTAEASHKDALELMYHIYGTEESAHFDVIDLDPYGSPALFIPAALVAVKQGGMLAVTATDTRVLCGGQQEVCFGRYGGTSMHNELDKETALRLIIKTVVEQACQIRLVATPLVSFFHAHYMRVFFKITPSSVEINRAGTKIGIVHSCSQCGAFYTCPFLRVKQQKSRKGSDVGVVVGNKGPHIPTTTMREDEVTKKTIIEGGNNVNTDVECICDKRHSMSKAKQYVGCPLCRSSLDISGPMWLGPLHDTLFVRKMKEMLPELKKSAVLANESIISALLEYQEQESIDGDISFYYSLSQLSKISKSSAPSLKRLASLIHSAGYKVSVVHTKSEAIRTNAPPEMMACVVRMWSKISHIITKDERRPIVEGSPSCCYLNGPSAHITREDLERLLREYKVIDETTPLDTIGRELVDSITTGDGPLVSMYAELPEGFAKERFVTGKTHLFLPNPEPNWGPKRAAPIKRKEKEKDKTNEEF